MPAAELTQAIAAYHAGCLRVIGAQGVAMRDVRTTKKAALAVDVGCLFDRETLLPSGEITLYAPPAPDQFEDPDARAAAERRYAVWERLRELSAKATVDSHAKEVLYAAPLLHGFRRKPRGRVLEPVLAPLLIQGVGLQVTSKGSINVRAQDEPPRFNTAVWKDTVKEADARQIVDLGLDAQADLAGGYSPERLATLLEGIASIVPYIASDPPTGELEIWPDLIDRRDHPENPYLQIQDGAVLFLANRASPYLLHDLEAIAEDPAAVLGEKRPLSVMVNPPTTELQPESIAPALDDVIYPFPSNSAQRQVADSLEKNQIVVVQGPPGNGKSLTIANLVAHLVASGKNVLVSSHKNQALTVVRDKLAESDLRFLYASLIGDGAAAKRELQRQIADVKAFAGNANKAALTKQLKSLEQRRAESGERYRRLRRDFIDRAEPEQEEASQRFEHFRGVSLLPLTDPALDEQDQAAAAAALRELDQLARAHADIWAGLRTGPLGESGEVREPLKKLGTFIEQQEARVVAASDESVHELIRRWHPITDGDPGQIDNCRELLGEIRADLSPVLISHGAREAAFKLADAPSLLADVETGTAEIETAFTAARALAEHRQHLSVSPDLRSQIIEQYLQLGSLNLIKRRAARKWLDQHAPGAAGLTYERLEKWSDFWDVWSRVRTLCGGLAGGLAVQLGESFDPDGAQATITRAQWASKHARAIVSVRERSSATTLPLQVSELLDAESVDVLDELLRPCQLALAALEADRTGNQFKIDPDLNFLDGKPARVDELIDGGSYDEAQASINELRKVFDALPSIAQRRRLLDGPLQQLSRATERIEVAAEDGEEPPAFLSEVDKALQVHPEALRFHEIGGSETTADLAEQLSELTERVMDDARELLGARIQERILEGFRSPSLLSSLEMFRKAVGGSPKRFERFEELKSSPGFDVDILTEVFPCWIMRPEDVCRVFPLRSDLFDVLIIDEASQCNPDQTLPLFARAKSVAVFGDDKQLSNEDLKRTLSNNANRSLLKQSGLDELDPGGLFDQTKHSLLELASRRQQSAVLLNEHFRCRPEIVAFSNDRFYGNTLRVIRDRQDDHGVGPAILLRQVQVSEPIPTAKGAKVNYVEAEALIEDLVRRLDDDRYAEMSFGVLSLFREQVEYLESLIESRVSVEQRERHRLICSTVDGFQGDERDVILYSWRFTAVDHPAVFAFTNGGGGEQRINVALTRSRHQAVHFISVPVEKFPRSAQNVTGYLEHAEEPESLLGRIESRTHREPSGRAREELREALAGRDLELIDDYIACGVSVDLLVFDRQNRQRVAVFVDADRSQRRPPDTPERVDQHSLLERAGWAVVRIPASEDLIDLDRSVRTVLDALTASSKLSGLAEDEVGRWELVIVDPSGVPVPAPDLLDLEIAPEDRADYHWDAPPVKARLNAGEAVFMSDFERRLYDMLAAQDGISVVPQWPSRGKSIDLVLTDPQGRRLAVEADGPQHHETNQGELIPEDLDRQALLEEAGWTFCRVTYRDFDRDPDGTIALITQRLSEQPENENLAKVAKEPLNLLEGLEGGLDESVSDPTATPVLPAPPPSDSAVVTAEEAPAAPRSMTDPADSEATSAAARADRDAAGAETTDFDDLKLGSLPLLVWAAVNTYGRVHDEELADKFTELIGIEVPQDRRKMLTRFAWSCKGRGFLDLDGAAGVWTPLKAATLDERYGEWTFNKIVRRAHELLRSHDDPFEILIHEVYDGQRASRLAMRIVGSAINEAKS